MKTNLEEAVSMMVRSLEEAIQLEVSMRVRAEVERALTERLSLLAGGPVASKSASGAAVSPDEGQDRGDTLPAAQRASSYSGMDPETVAIQEQVARTGSAPGPGLLQAKLTGGWSQTISRKRGPSRGSESPIPIGSVVRFAIGRLPDATGQVEAFNSQNGKIRIAYVNKRGMPMTTERDPSLVEIVD